MLFVSFLMCTYHSMLKTVLTLGQPYRSVNAFIDDKLKLQIADLLYAVDMQGRTRYLYLLMERQSSLDALMPFRLLKYMTATMDTHLKRTADKILPLVFLMVLYTGVKLYCYSMDILDIFDKFKDMAKSTLLQLCRMINHS